MVSINGVTDMRIGCYLLLVAPWTPRSLEKRASQGLPSLGIHNCKSDWPLQVKVLVPALMSALMSSAMDRPSWPSHSS